MTELETRQTDLAIEKYYSMIFKICLLILCNERDAEDATQETFIRYMTKRPAFHNEDHEKAWLIKVAENICKDILRKTNHQKLRSIEDCRCCNYDSESNDLLNAVMALPEKYKIVILLHCVYGYNLKEISEILHIGESAVKMRLSRGKEKLKKFM